MGIVLEFADSLVIGDQRCRLLQFASRTVDDYFHMLMLGFERMTELTNSLEIDEHRIKTVDHYFRLMTLGFPGMERLRNQAQLGLSTRNRFN